MCCEAAWRGAGSHGRCGGGGAGRRGHPDNSIPPVSSSASVLLTRRQAQRLPPPPSSAQRRAEAAGPPHRRVSLGRHTVRAKLGYLAMSRGPSSRPGGPGTIPLHQSIMGCQPSRLPAQAVDGDGSPGAGSCVRTLHGGPLPHAQACCRGGAPGEPVASSPQTVPRAEEEGGRGGPGVAPTLSPGLAAEGPGAEVAIHSPAGGSVTGAVGGQATKSTGPGVTVNLGPLHL